MTTTTDKRKPPVVRVSMDGAIAIDKDAINYDGSPQELQMEYNHLCLAVFHGNSSENEYVVALSPMQSGNIDVVAVHLQCDSYAEISTGTARVHNIEEVANRCLAEVFAGTGGPRPNRPDWTDDQRREWICFMGFVPEYESFITDLKQQYPEVQHWSAVETVARWHQEFPVDLKIQLSVYRVSRHFGGPEEGGWWYDWSDFTGYSERVYPEQVDEARVRLMQHFPPHKGQGRYSVLGGEDYEIYTELKCGDNQTKERPHYE